MSDDEDFATSKLRGDEPNIIDPGSGYSKLFKNKMGSRRPYYIVLTLVIIVFAALVLAVIGLSYANLKSAGQGNTKTCTTEDCIRSATLIVESMNRSVDPCEDFYQFACGRYENMHRIPKTSMSTDPFSEVHAKMLIFIRDFLEKYDSDTDPFSLVQSRLLYRSCMATDEMDTAGLEPMLNILNQIGLPHLGVPTKYSRAKSFSSILANVKKHLNLDNLFMTSVEPDPKNRTLNKIYLGKPSGNIVFPAHKLTEKIGKMSSRKIRETLASEETIDIDGDKEECAGIKYIKQYGKYFKAIWMEIHKHKTNSTPVSSHTLHNLGLQVAQIILFNNQLATIKDKVYETDQELPTFMTINELQNYTDNITQNYSQANGQVINWKEYFTILFADVENVTIDNQNDLIQISNLEYFDALFKVLVNSTEQHFILNVWWDVVVTLVPYTNNQLRFIQDRFYYDTTGLENNPSRSIYCANAVNSMMGMAVSRLLVDMESIERNKNMVIDMLANIHWAFEKIVKELSWMDDTTKKMTLYKAEQMKTYVGFPEFIKNGTELDDYYIDFEVNENDYFGNVIHYVQRDLNNTLSVLSQINDYDINSWVSNPLEVNAYNWIQANAITIPAGILQFPFFGHDLQVLNYGFLGSILGHELAHGFDNTGRKFDHEGNEHMWWTQQTIEEYEKRSNCFIDHYESYLVPGIEEKISGKLTLDENIADNGGIREALWAYRKFVAENGEEPKLPGLEELTNEQLYFLAFANNWCEASTLESLSDSLLDEHSPNYIRVIAGLTSSEEFSQVWKCNLGTRMNPKDKKCKIW